MGPLNDVRVVEFAGIGPGPFAGMLLADLGAEVVRIDRPGQEDLLGLPYDVLARGKRSLQLDLKTAAGVETALRLVEGADITTEGFRPGVMERLGLGPEACLDRNPRLVYGRVTGWGQDGPLATTAGHDIDYIALSGALNAIGPADGPPSPPLNLVGDFGGGGMLLAVGVLAALVAAARSGQGQVVDAAMVDGAALQMAMVYGMHAAGRWNNQRGANLVDGAAPFYGPYACADARWIAVAPIEQRFHRQFLEVLGLEADAFEPQMDQSQWAARRRMLAEVFLTRTRDEWCATFEGTDACVAPVLDLDEAPAHPHNRARQTFIERDGVLQPAPAPRFSRTGAEIRRPPPEPGEHSRAVLADWGFAPDAIAELEAAGAI